MQVRIIFQFEVEEENGEIPSQERFCAIAEDTTNEVRRRMVGEGFLPSDLSISHYRVTSEIVV